MFTMTTSTKNLKRRLGEGVTMPNKAQRIMSRLPDRMLAKQPTCAEPSPDDTIQEIQKRHTGVTVETPSYSELEGFFHAPTQAEIDAYQHDILAAVRSSKVDTLREFHKQGRPMKCSNEFGESILHLACRKGLTDVAKFLVEEANVPVTVCDDYGRNPLHDACWVHKPNFELMDLVLQRCPDLLFIKDRRGHTPLSFARRDQWKAWNDYLKTKTPEYLAPKELAKIQKKKVGSTSTMPPAPTPTNSVPKRPGVAASGIKIPTFSANVAAKGIKIPVANTALNLAMNGSPYNDSKPKGTTGAAVPVLKPLVSMEALKAGPQKSAAQAANKALVSASPASAALGGLSALLQASSKAHAAIASSQQHHQNPSATMG